MRQADSAGDAQATPSGAEWLDLALVFVGSLILYAITLAPTVVWGDDAFLQARAIEGVFGASAGSHPAWVLAAHLFSRVPIGEPAYRVNLTSAVWAALTLCLLYLVMRSLEIGRVARLLAVTAFAVSHTFWAHAVRPEVYAMTLALAALLTWLALEWSRHGGTWRLAAFGLTLGVALATHVLVLLYLPAWLWLLFVQRKRLDGKALAALGVSTIIGLAPLAYLLAQDARTEGLGLMAALRWALFSSMGHDFSQQFFGYSPAQFRADAFQWTVFLGYQFVGLALALAVAGFLVSWRRWPRWQAVFVLVLYAVPAAFAFGYDVGDRYVFYLPSYLAVVLWLGLGSERLLAFFAAGSAARRAALIGALLVMLAATPVMVYRLTPDVMASTGVAFREGRMVPGPGARYFLLWPPKNGYNDARDYAEAALAAAPQGSLLLADPILAYPLLYLQAVEDVRPDVAVEFCCWSAAEQIAGAGDRPLALADVAPEIYPVEMIGQDYAIVPAPPIYVLTPRQP